MRGFAERVAALAAHDPEAARKLVETATTPVDVAVGGAVLHAIGGDHERAIACARAAVELDPGHRSMLASMLLATGRAGEAAAILRDVIAGDPGDRDACTNLATAAFQLGDYGTAMASNARAFELDPSDRRPLRNLMAMFAEMGKWLGAMAALDLCRQGAPPPAVEVALDLVSVELVELIARAFPQPAIDADADATVARLVANAASRPPSTQLAIARALADIERFAEARELAAALAARTESLPPAERGNLHYVEGLLAEHDRDPARALDRYTRSLAADPHRSDAWVNASSLLLEQGALPRIAALLEQVAPEERAADPSLAFNESLYLARSGRTDDARRCLERVLQLTGGQGPLAARARETLARF